MTPETKAEQICSAIKAELAKGRYAQDKINSKQVSKACGVRNIGAVLDRKSVSLVTVLRIIEGLKSVATHRSIDISATLMRITDIIKS